MDNTNEGVKAMTVYVTTDYDGCEYITPGKPYELRGGHYITSDEGSALYIMMNGCAHLDGGNWRYTNEGMQIEEGTLKELNVKTGDVVECIDPRSATDHYTHGEQYIVGGDDDLGYEIRCDEEHSAFHLISRASDTPKVWGEMTDEEKGALLLAQHEGKVIECLDADTGEWREVRAKWIYYKAYRVRPEPKRETVTNKVKIVRGVIYMSLEPTHRITFDTIDGKPDCDSIKMEPIND